MKDTYSYKPQSTHTCICEHTYLTNLMSCRLTYIHTHTHTHTHTQKTYRKNRRSSRSWHASARQKKIRQTRTCAKTIYARHHLIICGCAYSYVCVHVCGISRVAWLHYRTRQTHVRNNICMSHPYVSAYVCMCVYACVWVCVTWLDHWHSPPQTTTHTPAW